MDNNINGPLGNLNRTYPAPFMRRPNVSHSYFNVGNPVVNLPKSIDLRKTAKVNIYDQGTTSSCSGNAIAAGYSILHMIKKGIPINLSRLFIYYNSRKVNGREGTDGGAHLADCFISMKNQGCCLESMWPFSTMTVTVQPEAMCYIEALKHCTEQQNTELNPNNLLNEIKQCLANNLPVVIGILVYTSMESNNVARTGYIPMPNTSAEQLRGGHALTVVGYNDDDQHVCIQNSWGTTWGDQGYGYIPYAFISNSNLTFDCHAFTQIEIDRSLPSPFPIPTPTPIPAPVPIPTPVPTPPNPWVNPQPWPMPPNPWVNPQPWPMPPNPWINPQPWPMPPNPWVNPRPMPPNPWPQPQPNPWFFPPTPRPRPRPKKKFIPKIEFVDE